jgi:hypothetical protein
MDFGGLGIHTTQLSNLDFTSSSLHFVSATSGLALQDLQHDSPELDPTSFCVLYAGESESGAVSKKCVLKDLSTMDWGSRKGPVNGHRGVPLGIPSIVLSETDYRNNAAQQERTKTRLSTQ